MIITSNISNEIFYLQNGDYYIPHYGEHDSGLGFIIPKDDPHIDDVGNNEKRIRLLMINTKKSRV